MHGTIPALSTSKWFIFSSRHSNRASRSASAAISWWRHTYSPQKRICSGLKHPQNQIFSLGYQAKAPPKQTLVTCVILQVLGSGGTSNPKVSKAGAGSYKVVPGGFLLQVPQVVFSPAISSTPQKDRLVVRQTPPLTCAAPTPKEEKSSLGKKTKSPNQVPLQQTFSTWTTNNPRHSRTY